VDTKWSIGPTFSGTSLDAMLFIVELVLKVKEEIKNKSERNIENVVGIIKELCNNNDWMNSLKWYDEKPISSDAIVNIILFLCDSEHYLPIPAQDKKRLISEKLSGLCKNENTEELKGMAVIDKNLYNIRESIRGIHKQNAEKEYEKKATLLNPFWQPSIRPFWDESAENLNNEKLSDETLLDYKKAMILYGPPGTSKSYQARRIAESMIAKALRKNEKSIVDCINQLQTTLDSHIHILQMHPNYTYDDYIVGKSIEGTNIVVKPGKMLQIIAGIKSDDNLPHFVILDEINRVDISRVFGELFTAMESSYREKGVELSVDVSQIPEEAKKALTIANGKLFLKVPENMYFIGTMNMIDFSLEQVDFALRRRFLWKLSTFDHKRLDEIISEKVAENIKKLQAKNEDVAQWNNWPDNFIECCIALNNEIEWESSLGKNYLIGHAFFAEIADIFEKVGDWGKAKNILWQVSILPTLDAYCGTMDAEMQKRFINVCKDAFFPELKDGKKKKDASQQSLTQETTNE
jgi:5-methylcytosine-specific restriction protein B